MVPLIKSGQKHVLEPYSVDKCEKGDIVFCKVKGSYYTHLVTGVCPDKGAQISNNKGRVNGWTNQVYGRVKEVL